MGPNITEMKMRRSVPFAIVIFLLAASFTAKCSAQISVGVKEGDWIEYQVTITGTPPSDHDISWARMDVAEVVGGRITLDVQTRFVNGTMYPETITLNLGTGVLGDDFIIPSNLNVGDFFHDKYQGDITILGVEQRTVAGVERTVLFGETEQTSYYWDKQTGVIVEATSDFSGFGYTMKTVAIATSMWQPQIFGLEYAVFYTILIFLIIIILAAIVVFVIWQRKRR